MTTHINIPGLISYDHLLMSETNLLSQKLLKSYTGDPDVSHWSPTLVTLDVSFLWVWFRPDVAFLGSFMNTFLWPGHSSFRRGWIHPDCQDRYSSRESNRTSSISLTVINYHWSRTWITQRDFSNESTRRWIWSCFWVAYSLREAFLTLFQVVTASR